MFKRVDRNVWAFDLEWVPDPAVGRAVYDLPAHLTDADVVAEMWRQGGATAEEPRPYLKTILCRIVSIAVVTREQTPAGVRLDAYSIPAVNEGPLDEAVLIGRFLDAVGKTQPQLVGFNSNNADLTILVQRGVARGVRAPGFCKRPDKPWEGVDYFARFGEDSLDLMQVLTAHGRGANARLHETALACGIPGKFETDGRSVADLWFDGQLQRIIQYNQCDAVTTFLLWLRTARFAGLVSPEEAAREESQLRSLLAERGATPGNEHLATYLARWRELDARRAVRAADVETLAVL